MNRTILKRFTQACYHGDYEPENVPKEVVEKFAELIVRECMNVIYNIDDLGGYHFKAVNEVKTHFGVKE